MDDLWSSIESFDAEAVHRVLTEVMADQPLSYVVREVLLPVLHEVGERWEQGSLSVAHEHFFTSLLMRRLSSLGSTPGPAGDGPVVVLACPTGERHELVLLCFGLLLGEAGCRVRFLGADTPATAMVAAVRASSADALVVAATRSTALTANAATLHRLSQRHPVYVAGQGADADVARLLGARLLPPDPVAAVRVVTTDLNVSPAAADQR